MLLPLLLTLSSPSFAEGAAELPVLTLETATLLGVDRHGICDGHV